MKEYKGGGVKERDRSERDQTSEEVVVITGLCNTFQ